MSTRSTRSSGTPRERPVPPKKLPRPASFATKPSLRSSEQLEADAAFERKTRLQTFMRRNRLKDVNEPQMPEGCFLFRLRRETFYPLHYAVLENDAEMVNMLLIAGSDPHQKSSKGRRPEDLARDLAADGNCETLDNLDKIIQTLQMAES